MLKRHLAAALLALLPAGVSAQVVEYYHLDAIGNVRAVTSQASPPVVVERHDYLPFGEEWNPQPGTQPKRFTGKERDAETGLDYFGARYYGSRIARFTTVDPKLNMKRALLDPQEWNRYIYGRNNPLRFVDPDGRESMSYPWGAGVTYNVGDRTMTPAPPLAASLALEVGIATAFAAPMVLAGGGATGLLASLTAAAANPGTQQTAAELLEGISGAPVGSVANPVPATLARVVPGRLIPKTLGRQGVEDVFVTAAEDIRGLNAADLAQRLAIPKASSYTVIEFASEGRAIASPINRTNPGFVGRGRTGGGAREYVVPNAPVPPEAKIRHVN
jgi:RHS repeat-associated protein